MPKEGINVQLRNFKNFDKILADLGSISKRSKIVKSSLKKGAKVVTTAVKKEIEPSDNGTTGRAAHKKGTLRRSIKNALRLRVGDRNFFAAAVYTNRGGGNVNSDGWYAHMVAFGHKVKTPDKKDPKSGAKQTKPNDFMKRGRDRSRLAFNNVIKTQLRNKLTAETQSKIDKLR